MSRKSIDGLLMECIVSRKEDCHFNYMLFRLVTPLCVELKTFKRQTQRDPHTPTSTIHKHYFKAPPRTVFNAVRRCRSPSERSEQSEVSKSLSPQEPIPRHRSLQRAPVEVFEQTTEVMVFVGWVLF